MKFFKDLFKYKPKAVEPYKAEPLIIDVNGKQITLITEKKAREIHEWALTEADKIIEKDKKKLEEGGPLFLSYLVRGLITGGIIERPSGREKR